MRSASIQLLPPHDDAFVAASVSKRPRGTPVPRTCSVFSRQTWRRLKLAAAIGIGGLALYTLASTLPIEETSAALTEWIRAHETAGFVVFPLVYWLLIPLCIPSSMFDLIGGSVFGMFYGIVLNTIGKTGGALLAFALGKKIGRERVGGYLETNFPMFTAVAAILESESWKPLLLVQLSTLPHAVKSYGLAITDVSTYRFMVSSFVTALPFTVLLTQIGYQTQEMLAHSHASSAAAATNTGSSSAETLLLVVGILFTLGTMAFFVIYTKREINRQLAKVGAIDKRSTSAAASVYIISSGAESSSRHRDDDVDYDNEDDMSERLLTDMCSTSCSSDNVPKHRSSFV